MSDLILTNSELTMFQSDRRRWWLSVYRKLGKPVDKLYNTNISIGTMYHAALASYYGQDLDPVQWVKEHYVNEVVRIGNEYDELTSAGLLTALDKEADLVTTMVEGYVEWLEEEAADSELEVLGAEQAVLVQLAPGLKLQGKIDAPARYRYAPDITLQLEHKTVGNFADIPKIAAVNFQFLTYDLLAYMKNLTLPEAERLRIDGVLVNMARKVKRTARANPPFFQRHEVRHNETQLRNHWKHVVSIGREIEAVRAKLDAGEDPQTVCVCVPTRESSWMCEYASCCLSGMMDDGSDVEGFLAVNFTERDPLERYADKAVGAKEST